MLHKLSPLLKIVLILSLAISISACAISSTPTTKKEKIAVSVTIKYLKSTIPQKTNIPWKLISIKQGIYQQENPLIKTKLPKIKVYIIKISGSIEQPVCPQLAKKGTICANKLSHSTYRVITLRSNNDIVNITSTS